MHAELAAQLSPGADKGLDLSIEDHAHAICDHVGRVAGSDYDEAMLWMDDLWDRMRNALGERPEPEYDEEEV